MRRKGFVDLQVNGWMGIDFSQPGLTMQEIREVTLDLLRRGTIAYCPTLVTGDPEMYRENLPLLAQAMSDPQIGEHILGIHLEGPFISEKVGARGAHPRCFVKRASVRHFDRLMDWADGKVALLTLDPEHRRAPDLIRHAVSRGVTVAMGHHFADVAAMQAAVDAGATCATHLGNGIPNKIDRHKNPLWWQLACDAIWGTFITDGHHLPPDLIRVALRAKTPARFAVVSDASPLAGLPPGQYEAFGISVVIEESGRIYSDESGGLVGSHSTLIECMNVLASLKILDEQDLWRVGQENPLKLIGKPPDLTESLWGCEVEFDGTKFTAVPL
ncbi:MAG: N-acetylglucosamine-6-phosphate deacetylase [Kiritimatiellae bacterium]|nr:N-acetylglucosamine-6-phosphate deacetylase [Kiritimatiellia bacterium]